MPSTKYRLKNIRLKEISLVDLGANAGSKVVIFKRGNSGETEMPSDEQQQNKERTMEEVLQENQALTEKTKFLSDSLEKMDERVKELEGIVAESRTESKDEDTDNVDKSADDILKALPAGVREQVQGAFEKAAAAEARIQKMEDEQMERTFVAKATTVFKSLPQKPEEFGPVLKRVAQNKATADDVLALESVLEAANKAIETGVFLKAQGEDAGPSPDSATARLDKLASELSKAESIPFEAAYTKVLVANKELYKQYLEEQQ